MAGEVTTTIATAGLVDGVLVAARAAKLVLQSPYSLGISPIALLNTRGMPSAKQALQYMTADLLPLQLSNTEVSAR